VTLRLFAVAEFPLVRWGLAEAARDDGDLEVVGEAESAHAAELKIEDTGPDVVFIELPLPDALRLASRLRDRHPELGIAIMGKPTEDNVVFRVMEAGASAVVFTDATVPELLATIKQAAHAPQWFTADKSQLTRAISPLDNVTDQIDLSPREVEVLTMLQDGSSVKAIALRLGISVSTAKTYVQRLYDKLDARNRSQALICAARRGLMP
jgi:DNA-binding NarL/FixJ family response regulator